MVLIYMLEVLQLAAISHQHYSKEDFRGKSRLLEAHLGLLLSSSNVKKREMLDQGTGKSPQLTVKLRRGVVRCCNLESSHWMAMFHLEIGFYHTLTFESVISEVTHWDSPSSRRAWRSSFSLKMASKWSEVKSQRHHWCLKPQSVDGSE